MQRKLFVPILVLVFVVATTAQAVNYQEIQLTDAVAVQEQPQIFGDYIVWLDWQNDQDKKWRADGGVDGKNKRDIVLYDQVTALRDDLETIITAPESLPNKVALTDQYVIWLDARADAPGLYSYNLETKQTVLVVALASYPQWSDFGGNQLAAYGNEAVYSIAGHGAVNHVNLETKENKVLAKVFVNALDFYGQKVVWSEAKISDAGVFLHDLSSSTTTEISGSSIAASLSDNLAVGDRGVVWLSGSKDSSQVKFYDFDSTQTLSKGSATRLYPVIHENKVVWSEKQATVRVQNFEPLQSSVFHLIVYDLQTEELTMHEGAFALNADVYENRVVFEGQEGIILIDLKELKEEKEKEEEREIELKYPAGQFLKGSKSTIFVYHEDAKIYAYPNEATYFTWYDSFSDVLELKDEELAEIEFAGYLTYKPGSRLIKQKDDARVYAVAEGGVRQLLSSEEAARRLYGEDWQDKVDVIPEKFWSSYTEGELLK